MSIFLSVTLAILIVIASIIFALALFWAGHEGMYMLLRYRNRIKYTAHIYKREISGSFLRKAFIKVMEFELTLENEVPFYLVNAYLHLVKYPIYEVDPKLNRILRVLEFNEKTGLIESHYLGSSDDISVYSNYSYKLKCNLVESINENKIYYNYIPAGVKPTVIKK